MKFLVLFLIVIQIGCANHSQAPSSAAPSASGLAPISDPKGPFQKVVFHLIEPLEIELILGRGKHTERLRIDKTVSQLSLAPGDWEVLGFMRAGSFYEMLDGSVRYRFSIARKRNTYAGSFLIQCPKVTRTSELKRLRYYNRYEFWDKERSCEMVVGNDFDGVNRVWERVYSRKYGPLSLGF
jgi:hypothetical protein